jgi:hypothetical protein
MLGQNQPTIQTSLLIESRPMNSICHRRRKPAQNLFSQHRSLDSRQLLQLQTRQITLAYASLRGKLQIPTIPQGHSQWMLNQY